jgi:hypothetical protein
VTVRAPVSSNRQSPPAVSSIADAGFSLSPGAATRTRFSHKALD